MTGWQIERDAEGRALVLSGRDLRELAQPCIYMFWRAQECLYVGLGSGLVRPLDPKHHAVSAHLREDDELLVIWPRLGADYRDLSSLERVLIHLLKPTLNKQRCNMWCEVLPLDVWLALLRGERLWPVYDV